MLRTTVAAALSAAALAACQPAPPADEAVNGAANAIVPELPLLPVAEPPMGREALLMAVARAASAFAAGTEKAGTQRALDGQRFEVRIRFGCEAPAQTAPANDGPFNLRFEEKDRTLRIRAAPDLTLDDPRVAQLAGKSVESVEGFWMHRPWLLTAACPARPQPKQPSQGKGAEAEPAAEPAPESLPSARRPLGPRVGLAEFYSGSDARMDRRDGGAYETTKVLDADQRPSRQGYDLVLSGRLRALEGGRVILCSGKGPDSPPDCIVSADIDQVRIERPDSRDVLAEWSA